MKKLLLTGASGFLGWNICHFAPQDWKITGIYCQNPAGLHVKTEALKVDLTDKDQIWKAIKQVQPDAVFHLAAFSNTNFVEKNPEETRKLNVDATAHLAEMCEDRQIRLLFTSSEQIFDGSKNRYAETDNPAPRNEYGKQKLEAEVKIIERMEDAAIVRIAVLFGQSGSVAKSFLLQWLESWQTLIPVTAFHDEIRSFLSGRSAAEGLYTLLEQGASGIFNLAGEIPLSRYEFALLAKETFRLPEGKVIAKSQQEVSMAAFRPPNLTLDNRKIAQTGFRPSHPKDELADLAKTIVLPPRYSEN
jgi:dTDP-4-dehydrorhamnose reductase